MSYTFKVSKPELIDYERLREESGAKLGKVTLVDKNGNKKYILIVAHSVMDKSYYQEGGTQAVNELFKYDFKHPMDIEEWAEAYSIAKRLVSLPLKGKKETTVTVETLI
jgi:hypothetical protein